MAGEQEFPIFCQRSKLHESYAYAYINLVVAVPGVFVGGCACILWAEVDPAPAPSTPAPTPPTLFKSAPVNESVSFSSYASVQSLSPRTRTLSEAGNGVFGGDGYAEDAQGNSVGGRVITAHSPRSVAGKWQYDASPLAPPGPSPPPPSWTDLPVLGEGEGFLMEGGVVGRIRFVPAEQINSVLAWEQLAEEVDNAVTLLTAEKINDELTWEQLAEVDDGATLPTFSLRAWDKTQGTNQEVATLVDLGASISLPASELTVTLYGIDGRGVGEAEEVSPGASPTLTLPAVVVYFQSRFSVQSLSLPLPLPRFHAYSVSSTTFI